MRKRAASSRRSSCGRRRAARRLATRTGATQRNATQTARGTSGGGGADGSASGGGGERSAAGGNAGVPARSSSAGSEAHASADAPADDAQRADGNMASGSIAADTRTEAAFTNTKQAGALTLSKQVAGNGAEPARTFAFAVRLTDADGAPLSGDFPYTLAAGRQRGRRGRRRRRHGRRERRARPGGRRAHRSLAAGQSVTVSGLPVGTAYAARETDADGYETTISEGDGRRRGRGERRHRPHRGGRAVRRARVRERALALWHAHPYQAGVGHAGRRGQGVRLHRDA